MSATGRCGPGGVDGGAAAALELGAVVVTGLVHVCLELAAGGGSGGSVVRPQHLFNLAACLGWGAYLLRRVCTVAGLADEWGFRRGGFLPAFKTGLVFAALAMVPLGLYGWFFRRFPLPSTFWLVVVLYPAWGLGQQFALQALIVRNLRVFVASPVRRMALAAIIFSVSHFPNWPLMALTLVAGVAFTWIYEKYRNLWAIGIVHGILGAVAYYVVLGRDPGAELLRLLK